MSYFVQVFSCLGTTSRLFFDLEKQNANLQVFQVSRFHWEPCLFMCNHQDFMAANIFVFKLYSGEREGAIYYLHKINVDIPGFLSIFKIIFLLLLEGRVA